MRTIAVVLNYRTPDPTVRAVRSLQNSTSPPAAIIVVDNGSRDGSAESIAAAVPGVTLLRSAVNVGFSAGCNIGLGAALSAGAEAVLLLNSDATVSPGALDALQGALVSNAHLGVVGPMIRSLRDPDEVQSLGIAYSVSCGRMRHIGCGTRASRVEPFDLRLVSGVSGCAMLIRAELLRRIGPLTEEYFFGFEDLDFCLRAARVGFQTACCGNAEVRHEGSASLPAASPSRIYFAARNHLLLAERSSATAPRMLRRARAAFIVVLNVAFALRQSDVRRIDALKAALRGVQHFHRGRFGPDTA
jgi:GT2 family glycosyltransferase